MNIEIEKCIDEEFSPKEEYGEIIKRNSVSCVLTNDKNEVALLYWKEQPWVSFVGGGVEESEDLAEAGKREIIEETGYSDIEFVKEFERSFECVSSADHKKQNRSAHIRVLHFKLNSEQIEEIEEYEKNQHEVKWVPIEKVPSEITGPESQKVFEIFKTS